LGRNVEVEFRLRACEGERLLRKLAGVLHDMSIVRERRPWEPGNCFDRPCGGSFG
jgi:hypothetical protein